MATVNMSPKPNDALPQKTPGQLRGALAVNMRVGLLFDLRVAEQLRMANTGLIVLGGVEAFEWRAERRPTARTSWNVDASVPANRDGVVNLRLIFFPSADLTVAARSAAFFAGDVPGLPEAPHRRSYLHCR
jgi:hypothetical protein